MIVIWDYSQRSSDLHICVICLRLLRFFNESRIVCAKDHLNLRLTKLIKKTIRTDFRSFLYGVPIDTLVLGHMPNDLSNTKVMIHEIGSFLYCDYHNVEMARGIIWLGI